MVFTAAGNETCVVLEPHYRLDRALVAPEYSIWDSLVGPKSEDLYVAFLVIACIQVASGRKLDLRASSHLGVGKLRHGYVVLVDCVNAHSVDMSNYDVKAAWMDGHSHDGILKALDEL